MAEQVLKPVLKKPPGYQQKQTGSTKPVPKKPLPVRRPVLPVSHRSVKKKRSCSCRKCCCATCLVLLILILLIAVTGCVMYLILEPKVPVIHLQSVRFKRFNVSDGVDGANLISEAVVRVQVRNRNQVLRVNYGKTVVGLRSGDVDLGMGSVPGFSQAKKDIKVLKLSTKVKQMLEIGSGKKMRDNYKSKRLMIGIEVNTEIGVGVKKWNTIKIPIKAICDGVSLKKVEGGSFVPKCKITLLKIFSIKAGDRVH